MYAEQHDPRYSQARTDSYYNTASPSSLPPPLPAGLQSNLSLGPSITSTPRASSGDPFQDAYPDRELASTPNNNSAPLLPTSGDAAFKDQTEASPYGGAGATRNAGGYPYADVRSSSYGVKPPFYKRRGFLIGMGALLAAVVVAIVVPVIIVNHHNSTSASTSGATGKGSQGGNGGGNGGGGTGNGNGGGGKGTTNNLVTWGGDGSTVTTDDGSTFVYKNSFGGYCEFAFLADPLLLLFWLGLRA